MRTKSYKPITTAQIKKIHVLLNQKGLMNEKRVIIHSFSDGRTTSTKELTCYEAKQLIGYLNESDKERDEKARKEVRTIYALAWRMGMIYGDTDDDYQMNIAKLNVFCRERGTVKKNITAMSLEELRKTHRQFEAMHSSYEKKKMKCVQ